MCKLLKLGLCFLFLISFIPLLLAAQNVVTGDLSNKVEGLELPLPMIVGSSDGYVLVKASFAKESKVEQLDWIVIFTGTQNVKSDIIGEVLIIAVPPSGETAIIYAVALVDGKLKKAMTTVTTRGTPNNNPPNKDPNIITNPTPIPANVKNLHVVLVIDIRQSPKEVQDLANSEVVINELKKSNSKFYVFDLHAEELSKKKIKPLIEKLGSVPALVVLSNDGRVLPVGQAQSVTITNDAKNNENILLDLIGKSVFIKQ